MRISESIETLTCAQADDLVGGYALDALSAPEAPDVEAHLESCLEHRKMADELRDTVSLLALSVDERDPSPGLRDRVIQSGRSSASEPVGTGEVDPVVVPIRRAPRLPRWAPQPALVGMAATVLLAVGIGIFAGHRLGQSKNLGSSQSIAYQFTGGLLAPTAQANLVYLPLRRHALLAVKGLPPLGPGHVYEMWLVNRGGIPTDVGISAAPDGQITAQMDTDLSRYRQFAITVEPRERPSPTTEPVLKGTLQGGSA